MKDGKLVNLHLNELSTRDIVVAHIACIRRGEADSLWLSGSAITDLMWPVIDAAVARDLPLHSTLDFATHTHLTATMQGATILSGPPQLA